MKLTEYYELVEAELEKSGFCKVVEHYQPPIDIMSTFILELCTIGLHYNLSASSTARMIEMGFSTVTEAMFPLTKH